jgi:hypothetical protein
MQAYNKMHVRFRVQVEWRIGGVKRKWKRLMKRFGSTKSKFTHLFRIVIIYINLIQRRHMDLTYQVVGDQNPNLAAHGWQGDF